MVGCQRKTSFVMSSFVRGSMSRTSMICLERRIRCPPIRAWAWTQTRFQAESMFLGTDRGGFSIRWTTEATESACMVA